MSESIPPEVLVELEPCPFCGVQLVKSRDLSRRTVDVFIHPTPDITASICLMVSAVVYSNDDERITAWNTRSTARSTEAMRAALEAQTGELAASRKHLNSEYHTRKAAEADAVAMRAENERLKGEATDLRFQVEAQRTRATLLVQRMIRLGSMEAFVRGGIVSVRRDEELLARIEYARAAEREFC